MAAVRAIINGFSVNDLFQVKESMTRHTLSSCRMASLAHKIQIPYSSS